MAENSREALLGKHVDVLDKGWIELQDVMGDDTAIVNAARVSYLGESKGPDRDKKLLFYLLQHRHTTPFEMVEFKFRVKCPIIVARQWLRHRTFSVNEISRRYSSEEIDFYIPDTWRTQSDSNKQASGADSIPLPAPRSAPPCGHTARAPWPSITTPSMRVSRGKWHACSCRTTSTRSSSPRSMPTT